MRRKLKSRSGAAIVEFALVVSAMTFLLLGTMIGGLGVFRYQQISWLARECSRYASVHGSAYAAATGLPAATPTSIYNNVIAPKGVALNLTKLSYTITWNTNNGQYHTVVNSLGDVTPVINTVSVTINYNWVPEAFASSVTLTSTSVTPMSF